VIKSLILLLFLLSLQARPNVNALYQRHCAECHGTRGEGGLGGSLIDGEWKHGGSDADKARVIRDGIPEMGMQGFGSVLNEQEIRALVVYMDELAAQARPLPSPEQDGEVFSTDRLNYRLETLLENRERMWGVSFLPDGGYILTETSGAVRLLSPEGELFPPLQGTPEVADRGQGGMLDVAVHPNFRENGWVYLSFSEGEGAETMTAVVRGRIRDNHWVDEEEIYRADREFYSRSGVHFGTRVVFKNGYVYFAIGDRGAQRQAQDPGRPNGKIHRLHEDGRIPADNPYIQSGGLPSLWTLGNRNPQGLAFHPATGELWSTEHGPRGGDELNLIQRGLNYGWPLVTHGLNYNGTPITAHTEMEGMEPPVFHWTPSIAVCGMAFADGGRYPEWENDVLAGGLRGQVLERLRIRDGEVVEREAVLKGLGRVRDTKTSPEGFLYLILEGRGARLVRLVPER